MLQGLHAVAMRFTSLSRHIANGKIPARGGAMMFGLAASRGHGHCNTGGRGIQVLATVQFRTIVMAIGIDGVPELYPD